jgi:hypothetical protein
MTERVWHEGPPPHVGWWNTMDTTGRSGEWRWWNGSNWSIHTLEIRNAEDAALNSTKAAAFTLSEICWSDYWPENARVPRLDPTDGDWTFNVDGKMPNVDGPIELQFRGGSTYTTHDAEGWYWDLPGYESDIVAWRKAVKKEGV